MSWRISRTSSTSDAPGAPGAHGRVDLGGSHRLPSAALGVVRLVHPFPSLLDALVVVAIATIAGADVLRAGALGVAMFSLQASIGALNDLTDRDADLQSKPHKPLVGGLVTPATARAVVVVGLVVGLLLSVALGLPTAAVAVTGVVIGYLYDLRLKGTAWAWLPFALGVPLLPVYAWVGAQGVLPGSFGLLVPAAVAAGAALALGNQLADLESDRASATASTARLLGPGATLGLMTVGYTAVSVVALGSSIVTGAGGWGLLLQILGAVLVAAGVASARAPGSLLQPRAWELQAMGVATVAAGWVAALSASGSL